MWLTENNISDNENEIFSLSMVNKWNVEEGNDMKRKEKKRKYV